MHSAKSAHLGPNLLQICSSVEVFIAHTYGYYWVGPLSVPSFL